MNSFFQKIAGFPFLIYLVFFLLLFLQFPIAGSLPGKIDTWCYVTVFNTIENYLVAFLSGEYLGTALYPEENVYEYQNYSFGMAAIALPFKWIGLNDITSYYFFISLLFALNAYGVYHMARALKIKAPFALLSGFFFAACNFSFANMDNPDALFFGWSFLSISFFFHFLDAKKTGDYILCIFLAGVGVYFSSYIFLFTGIVLAVIAMYYWKRLLLDKEALKTVLFYFLLLPVIIYPYLNVYMFDAKLFTAYNMAENYRVASVASLHPADLFRFLEFNMAYPRLGDMDINWLSKTRSAGAGILLWVFGTAGLLVFRERRILLLAIWLIFFLLALGPFIYFGEDIVSRAPFYFLYEYFNIHQLFRIGVRGFFISLLILALTACYFLQYIFERRQLPRYFLLLILLLFFLENIPYKFQKYNSAELSRHEVDYSFMEKDAVILNLPSVIMAGFYPGFDFPCDPSTLDDYEFYQVREYLYMYYQTSHKRNILNAVCSFYPDSRMENQKLIQQIQQDNNLDKLIERNGLSYIIFHKKFTNGCSFDDLINFLDAHPKLDNFKESDEVIIYKVNISR